MVTSFHKREQDLEKTFADVGTSPVEKRLFVCPRTVTSKGVWPETTNVCEVKRKTLTGGGRSVEVVSIRVKSRIVDGKVVRPPAGKSYLEDYYKPDKSKTKSQICLHFTAGMSDPSWLMRGDLGYPGDNNLVGVPFVVSSTGTVFELFEDEYWGNSSSSGINNQIIAIELGNYGPVALYTRANGSKFWGPVGSKLELCTEEEGHVWVETLPTAYRGYQSFFRFSPEQYKGLNQLLAYLTAKYNIDFKLLPDDQPSQPEKSLRFRCLNPYYAAGTGGRGGYEPASLDLKSFRGIVSHVNWAGKENNAWLKWDIGPAFEWDHLRAEPELCYPFQKLGSPMPPLPAMYFGNEVQDGGNYVVGRHVNIHGGIHIRPSDGGGHAPVRVIAPGVVVAARLHPAGSTAKTVELTGNYNGLVLVRHQLVDVAAKKEFPIFSLYMHLSYPSWTGTATEAYADVPWARRFFLERNGAVIDARLGKTFGQLHWVATPKLAPDAAQCNVYQPGSFSTESFALRESVKVQGKTEERTIGIVKSPAEEIAKAAQSLQDGKLVTFHDPYLFVGSGEVIGHVDVPAGTSGGFLHWEVFSASDDSGLRKMLNLHQEIGQDIAKTHLIEDQSNDNYLSKTDFVNLIQKAMHAEERKAFEPILSEDAAKKHFYENWLDLGTYAKEYDKLRRDTTVPFAQNVPSNPPLPKGMLAYGLDLVIKKSALNLKDGQYKLTLSFVDESDKLLPSPQAPFTTELNVSLSNTDYVKRIAVPAGTAKIRFVSTELDIGHDAPTLTPAKQKQEDQALLQQLVDYRLRNVLLKHVTEWSEPGLKSLYNKHEQLKQQFKFEDIQPSVWWATTAKDHGEFPVFGNGSLFGTKELPKSGEIDNLHPVTALGVLWLLQKQGKIGFATPASTFSPKQKPDLIYLGWATRGEVLMGSEVGVLAVREDYRSGEQLRVYAEGAGRSLELGALEYSQGVAKTVLSVEFWGKWTLKAQNLTPSPSAAKLSSKAKPGPVELDIPVPQLSSVSKATVISGSRQHTMRLTFASNCPPKICGLVVFKCARIPNQVGQGKPASTPQFQLSKRAIVVTGTRNKPGKAEKPKAGAPPSTAGTIDVSFDTSNLLREFADEVGAANGDHVQVAAGIYLPNGGAAALESPAEYGPGEHPHQVQLLPPIWLVLNNQKEWTDDRGLGIPPDTSNPCLVFENASFGDFAMSMDLDALVATVPAGLAPAEWKKMRVQMCCNGKPIDAKCHAVKKGDATVAAFVAALGSKQLKTLKAIGTGASAQFSISVVEGSTLGYTAPERTWGPKSLVPVLGVPEHVDPTTLADTDPRYRVFKGFLGGHKKPGDYYCLLGRADWMETSWYFVINCFVKSPPPPAGPATAAAAAAGKGKLPLVTRADGFSASPDLDRLIEYSQSSKGYGSCDANGYFGAWIPRKALQGKPVGTQIKFVWGRPSGFKNIIWEVEVAPKECRDVYVVKAG